MPIQKAYDYLDIMRVGTKGTIVYVSHDSHSMKDPGQKLPDPGNKSFINGKSWNYLSD